MRIQLRAHGAASPETAWKRYADPSLWSTWSPQISRVEASTTQLATGTSGVVVGHGGLLVAFVVSVVDDAARRWRWQVEPTRAAWLPLPRPLRSLGRMSLEHAVLPTAGTAGGSMTTLTVQGHTMVALAYAPLAWLALRRLVARPTTGRGGRGKVGATHA